MIGAKPFSTSFPNLETLNWFEYQVKFLGPGNTQDTRLGENRHLLAKETQKITNGHFDSRDVLKKV